MDDNNKCFCILPWVHLSVYPSGDVYPCCISSEKYGSINTTTLEDLWNCDEIKQLRLNMLNGVFSENCSICYNAEELGGKSLRNILNSQFSHHSTIVETTQVDGTLDKLNLIYWDFRFSNKCNFKCRMCNPINSSSWGEELKRMVDDHNSIKKIDVLENLEPLYEIVEEIYFAGGEPLIMDEHYEIIDRLLQLKKYDVKLKYNTNFSVLKYKDKNILDIWKNFSNIELVISLDGYGKRGEILRNGLNWNKFLDNINTLKENYDKQYSVTCVFQALNCFHITDFHKYLYDNKIIKDIDDFCISILSSPDYLSVEILPEKVKNKICENIYTHINSWLIPNGATNSIEEYESIIKFLKKSDNKSYLIPKFKKYISALDEIRNEDTLKVFPELADILNT